MTKVNKIMEDNVTVVIPFYNRARFLKRLLDSIEKQTLAPKKIFIVDNGSSLEQTNIAWDIIGSHKLFNKCCFLSSIGRGNANYARNVGYYLADTKYVAFLDSDDWWEENHLSQSLECLKNSNKVAVYSGAIVHKVKGTTVEESIDIESFDNPFSLILPPHSYLAQTSSYIVNKSSLEDSVVWDERLKRHQDFDYFAAIFYQTSGWCYCPKVNVNIDWNHTNDTSKNIDFNSLILFYEKWSDQIPNDIKKSYLMSMLYYAHRHKTSSEVKSFYRNELRKHKFFDDWKYRAQSHNLYVLMRINSATALNKVGLKNTVKKILKVIHV